MRRRLSKIVAGAGACGLAVIGMTTAASAATTASAAVPQTPVWRTIFSLANGTTSSNAVETVIATGRTSVWGFLANGTAYEYVGGNTWKKVALPEKGGAVNIAAATSPGNVWAAYHTASGTHLDRWNGKKWTLVRSFPGQVTGLSVLGPGDVWVFGGLTSKSTKSPQGVFHFNGHRWTEVTSALQGGNALSDRNVWGYAGTKIAHFDGRRWTEVNVAGLFPAKTAGEYTSPVLTGILALAPNNVYATGEGPIGPHSANGVILHYNGLTWSKAARAPFLSSTGQQFTSDGRGGLWISAQNVEGPSLLFHYSAGTVTRVNLPGSATVIAASNSVSRIPGTTDVLSGGALFNVNNPAASRAVIFLGT